jgi:hypothetical protein
MDLALIIATVVVGVAAVLVLLLLPNHGTRATPADEPRGSESGDPERAFELGS